MIDWAIMNDAAALTLAGRRPHSSLRRSAASARRRRARAPSLHFGLPPEPLTDTEKCTAIRRRCYKTKELLTP